MTMTVGHSSPDTQAVGALHRLAVPQEEAALVSEPLQQTLCDSAPDAAKVEGPDQRAFQLHAECRATVHGLRRGVPTHVCVCVQEVRRQNNKRDWFSHFFYTSATHTVHIFSLCRCRLWFSCERTFSPSSIHFLYVQQERIQRLTIITFLFSGHKLTVCKMNYCK